MGKTFSKYIAIKISIPQIEPKTNDDLKTYPINLSPFYTKKKIHYNNPEPKRMRFNPNEYTMDEMSE
jgi:hypothetical protein